ncbi:MAG: Fic family protein, partial [Deltaproteobacteria bacterium]|nr:Fic family protein [Deltaproteobacteria bacterium]
MFNPEILISFNELILGDKNTLISKQNLLSVFSSWHYYEGDKERIISIFRGLIKNHPFRDGNKRTAVAFLKASVESLDLGYTWDNDTLI